MMTRIALLLLLVALLGGCAEKKQRPADEYFTQANEDFRNSAFNQAVEEYRELLDQHPFSEYTEEVELKIVRTGRVFTAYWRLNDESEWWEAGEFESDYPDTVLAGVAACNTAREVTAEFAYIRLLPALKSP